MKFSEVKNMSQGELKNLLRKKSDEVYELRVKNKLGQVANPLLIRANRKDIARVMTAMNSSSAKLGATSGKQ